jgi:2-C-methyl-D-erythritol 2,4-cyclodiphosphate synthase
MYRIGHGIDVHALCDGRPCVLGGVTVPSARGLAGHSDADVVVHALCDALLGAAALPDIGALFPDTDERYRGIASTHLLQQVVAAVHGKGYRIANADVTIMAEEPRLGPYVTAMRETLAALLGISTDAMGVKATTTEQLGFVGRAEGIEAHAVCLLCQA